MLQSCGGRIQGEREKASEKKKEKDREGFTSHQILSPPELLRYFLSLHMLRLRLNCVDCFWVFFVGSICVLLPFAIGVGFVVFYSISDLTRLFCFSFNLIVNRISGIGFVSPDFAVFVFIFRVLFSTFLWFWGSSGDCLMAFIFNNIFPRERFWGLVLQNQK